MTEISKIKWYELIKGFIISLSVTVLYFVFMQYWIGYNYGFFRRIFAVSLLVWIRPAAEPVYVLLTLLTFFATLYLHKKNCFQKINAILFLILAVGLAFCFDIFLASTDKGFLHAIPHPYIYYTPYEYYSDIPKIKGIRSFLRDYASMMPNLSLHANTHPPGGDIFLYLVERIFGKGAFRASLISIFVSNLSIIPFYLIARLFLNPSLSRLSAILWIFTPNIAIYSATCMDGVFTFFLLWPFYFFIKFTIENKNLFLLSIINGIALSLAMFMNFSTAFHGLFFIILTGLFFYRKVHNSKRVLLFLIISGLVFGIFYIMLFYSTGYNIFACLDQAREKDLINYGSPFRDWKIYTLSRTVNFVGFFAFSGFATIWLWFKYLFKKGLKEKGNIILKYCVYAFIITLLEMNLGGLYFFETARIWMFLSPFIILPVIELIDYFFKTYQKPLFDIQLLSLTFIQTLIVEIIFYTLW